MLTFFVNFWTQYTPAFCVCQYLFYEKRIIFYGDAKRGRLD